MTYLELISFLDSNENNVLITEKEGCQVALTGGDIYGACAANATGELETEEYVKTFVDTFKYEFSEWIREEQEQE